MTSNPIDAVTTDPPADLLAWMSAQCDQHEGRKDCARKKARAAK